MAARMASSTALRFSTGSAPGYPRQTGQTLVLGGAPNRVVQEQKIFVAVKRRACTSRPMTASHSDTSVDYRCGIMRGHETRSRAVALVGHACHCAIGR